MHADAAEHPVTPTLDQRTSGAAEQSRGAIKQTRIGSSNLRSRLLRPAVRAKDNLQQQLDFALVQQELMSMELESVKDHLLRRAKSLSRIRRHSAGTKANEHALEASVRRLLRHNKDDRLPRQQLVAKFGAWRVLRDKRSKLEEALSTPTMRRPNSSRTMTRWRSS